MSGIIYTCKLLIVRGVTKNNYKNNKGFSKREKIFTKQGYLK